MGTRRGFLKKSAFLSSVGSLAGFGLKTKNYNLSNVNKPIVISTWEHGIPANQAAWAILEEKGRAIDAVEAEASGRYSKGLHQQYDP